MKNAVIGAGSIGTIVGARATKNRADIVLVDADREVVKALNSKGATLTGTIEETIPVKAITPQEMTGIYSIVILTTKQTVNKIVLENLLPHLDKNSIVCTLQNGIPEETVAAYVGKERTVGGTVGFGATYLEPGVTRLTSSLEALETNGFKIGNMDSIVTPQLQSVCDLLSKAGGCIISTDLMSIRWSKLLINATMSGMSAALGCLFKDVLYNDKARRCAAHVADETIKVAHALGVRLAPAQGVDLELLELSAPDDVPNKRDLFFTLWGPHENLKASMLQDIEKGRRCEIDFINGVVCAKGRECGVATPFNDKVTEMIKAEEASGRINTFEALSQFDILLP